VSFTLIVRTKKQNRGGCPLQVTFFCFAKNKVPKEKGDPGLPPPKRVYSPQALRAQNQHEWE